jgi:glycerate kinase
VYFLCPKGGEKMASEIGQLNVRVGLDSTGFQNGISSLNREMKKVQSEFKLASAEMGKHGKELDSLRLKSDNLTKQTDLQRQKVAALEAAHQRSVQTKGADAKATQDLEIKLNRARTRLVNMEQDLESVNREIETQSSNWYKLGKELEAAAKRGCKKIIVGLGGSSTNDGGCGAAAAAGVKFYDRQGKEFIPVGKTLIDIDRIDLTHRARELNKIEIITMCDIDNPMYGPEGAAFVFGPQKGADEKMVIDLDRGLEHLCRLIERETRRNLKDVPGTGAAGAMGAGMIAFFDSVLQMGIETVLDTVKFDEIIAGADMIFTGEGRFDTQSLRGKVVVGVGKRAKSKNIPVTVITGGADTNIEKAYDMGISSIFTINRLPEDFEISRHKSKENLQATVDNILRLIKSLE